MKTTLAPSTIMAGFLRQLVWIRIGCKGSVDCSHELRQFIELMVTEGHHKMVIDLDNCPGMDSTFMGTLAGISLRLRQVPGGSLDIVNAGERNLQSLRELGLDAHPYRRLQWQYVGTRASKCWERVFKNPFRWPRRTIRPAEQL